MEKNMSNVMENKEGITVENYEDIKSYEVDFIGMFNTPELVQKAFMASQDEVFGLSVVLDKKEKKILIGDAHGNMRANARARLDKYGILYAKFDPKSGGIEVGDFSDFSDEHKHSLAVGESIKREVARKIKEAVFEAFKLQQA